MLVNKSKYAVGDIVSLKISNGDEVVAKFVEETDNGFMVKKPMTVMPTQNGIVLVPSLFTSDSDSPMFLSFQHIMLHSLTVKEMSDHYIKKTTGIQLATSI